MPVDRQHDKRTVSTGFTENKSCDSNGSLCGKVASAVHVLLSCALTQASRRKPSSYFVSLPCSAIREQGFSLFILCGCHSKALLDIYTVNQAKASIGCGAPFPPLEKKCFSPIVYEGIADFNYVTASKLVQRDTDL